ncbi:MAG: WecB/TagA/CpsF family glycosyltransferase [Lachnospiraceae bacterium]|nr:WecB/TagA/CpsF family glycosyltransferase [Lachnospiraceae bacterium]
MKTNYSNEMIYIKNRDFYIYNTVGVNVTTLDYLIEELFKLPVSPISAAVLLVGIPAIVSAVEDSELASIYNKATIAAIDGMPLVKKARKKGFKCDRCSGLDFMEPVFAESIKHEKAHFFYGGKNDRMLKKMRKTLEEKFPGIKIAGMYSPPFRPLTEIEDNDICEIINNLRPDFLWVGIGAPKQEIWIHNHRERINDCTMIGVGAAFGLFDGTYGDTPKWIRQGSLEWLYRLAKEPRRLWKRYILGGIKFLWYGVKFGIR